MASRINEELGSFATDAAATAYVTGLGWTIARGVYYWNTTDLQFRMWNGTTWVGASGPVWKTLAIADAINFLDPNALIVGVPASFASVTVVGSPGADYKLADSAAKWIFPAIGTWYSTSGWLSFINQVQLTITSAPPSNSGICVHVGFSDTNDFSNRWWAARMLYRNADSLHVLGTGIYSTPAGADAASPSALITGFFGDTLIRSTASSQISAVSIESGVLTGTFGRGASSIYNFALAGGASLYPFVAIGRENIATDRTIGFTPQALWIESATSGVF